MDEFQDRYLEHQNRKKDFIENQLGHYKIGYEKKEKQAFNKVLRNRRSQRVFIKEEVSDELINELCEAVRISPSSCNRQAVYIRETSPEYAEQMFVGAKNWSKNANRVLMLFADKIAYKSPNEKAFMPFLDMGYAGQSVCLMAETLELGLCFVNPNIREENRQEFIDKYGDDYFGGSFIIGHYDNKAKIPPLRSIDKVKRK